ncbi:hypothetical protein BH11ACT4_BH11ACT4_14000 [soil metagenome]
MTLPGDEDAPSVHLGDGHSTRLARFIASPAALVIAGAIALTLVAILAVTAVRFFTPQQRDPIALGVPIPSAFALQLDAASSPFVSRGGTVTLAVNSSSSSPIERLEIWADDAPYIVIDDPALIPADAAGHVALSLDYVAMTAGAHLLMARATDAAGRVAQSAPMATPVLDLAPDAFGPPGPDALSVPDTQFLSAPGDSLQGIADRLGVSLEALRTFDPIEDAAGVLATGTTIDFAVPRLDALLSPTYKGVPWTKVISANVVDCIVHVSSTADYPIRVYGGAGNAALGDVPAHGDVAITNLPVGPTVFTGLRVGTPWLASEESKAPTVPVTATLPDSCAKGGWTGDAVISGGILITDDQIQQPYAYLSIDKGAWQRIPAEEGSTLNTAVVNDIRSYVALGTYDQLDLEVWTAAGTAAHRAASGQFCRADMTTQNLSASSGSGGECDPPGALPGVPGGGPVAVALDLDVAIPAGSSASYGFISTDDAVLDGRITDGGPITLSTNAKELGYSAIRYQFTYAALSQTSPLLNPPGMFYSIDVPAGQNTTVEPGKWQNASLTTDEANGTDKLSLSDQLALTQAKSNLATGKHLVDDVFIRAVAISTSGTGEVIPLGAASRTWEVNMPSAFDGSWPVIGDVRFEFTPGVDQDASWSSSYEPESNWNPAIQSYGSKAVRDVCHEVLAYPDAGVWATMPSQGPWSRPAAHIADFPPGEFGSTYFHTGIDYLGQPRNPGDQLISAGQPVFSDLELAKRMWPTADYVYCLEDGALQHRDNVAADQAREKNKCTLGCVLTFMVYGAVQGFLTGGPYGAIAGAIVGLAIGVMAAASPQFYADLQKAWDAIAHIYNVVFDKVFAFVDAINPVCQGFTYLAKKAGEYCNGTVRAAASAVITYYTGLPPQLPTSAQLESVAQGDMQAALVLVLDQGLAAIGLSCSSFTIDSEQAAKIARDAAPAGTPIGPNDTTVSGCGMLARALTKTMVNALHERNENLMQGITGEPAVRGLVLAPFSDRVARITIDAPAPDQAAAGTSCPVIINTTVTENGTSYRFVPEQSTMFYVPGVPTGIPDVLAGDPFWHAEFPVGVLPQTVWTPSPDPLYNAQPDIYLAPHKLTYYDEEGQLIEKTPAAANAPYLHIAVDSPCFRSTYVVDAAKYASIATLASGLRAAFIADPRPAVGFW